MSHLDAFCCRKICHHGPHKSRSGLYWYNNDPKCWKKGQREAVLRKTEEEK
jgi:hypothetical protein